MSLPPLLFSPPEGYYDVQCVKQEYLRNWRHVHDLPNDTEIERVRGVVLDERHIKPTEEMLDPDYVFTSGEDNQAYFFRTMHYDPATKTLTHFYRTNSSINYIGFSPMTEAEAEAEAFGPFAGRIVQPDRTRLVFDKTPEELARETVRMRHGPGGLTKAARPPSSVHNSR